MKVHTQDTQDTPKSLQSTPFLTVRELPHPHSTPPFQYLCLLPSSLSLCLSLNKLNIQDYTHTKSTTKKK